MNKIVKSIIYGVITIVILKVLMVLLNGNDGNLFVTFVFNVIPGIIVFSLHQKFGK